VAPMAFLIVFIIVLMLGNTLGILAREFPSAGGYFTYISRTVHPRVGMFAAWLFFLYNPLVPAPILAYMGKVIEDSLKAEYDFTFPWWLFFILGFAISSLFLYRGISISGKALLVLGLVEIAIAAVLSVWGLFDAGPGGVNLQPFNPSNIQAHGLYLAVIFSIFSYTGWEGAASIAEESENPSRNVPRATYGAIIFQVIFLAVCSWALLIGWGTDKIGSLVGSAELPPIVLAHRFWGGAWIIVLLALINSTIAVCIASTNVTSRMWFAMGRAGALPSWFAKVHPKYKTPVNALYAQFAVIIVSAVIGVWWWGVGNIWFVDGLMITFALTIIYIFANLGVVLYFWRERRSEFNFVRHGLFPIASSIALVILDYKSLNPFPAAPAKYGPIVVGIWIVLGVLLIAYLRASGKEGWLMRATQAANERPETPEELAHRPAI
jgi:amino acid transporter